MKKYSFTLVLAGSPELTEELAERLYVAGCNDGSPGMCNDVTAIDFHREAESLEAALRSAIADVNSAGCVVARAEIEAAVMGQRQATT
ncbi:MAG: hypothetical protein KJ000_20765 [Pirellulaceae bacterium]|nr:hypothetical protein [Pirellulaceae bacterium]